MSWRARTRVYATSARAEADRGDLFLAWEVLDVRVAVLIDGSPGRSSARPPWPREALFAAARGLLGSERPPEALLGALDDALRSGCVGGPGRLAASATAVWIDDTRGEITLAEAGDTRAWGVGDDGARPLQPGPLPTGATVHGMLGDSAPEIRAGRVSLEGLAGVVLLTDGAWTLLRDAQGGLPANLDRYALAEPGRDDATVVVLLP